MRRTILEALEVSRVDTCQRQELIQKFYVFEIFEVQECVTLCQDDPPLIAGHEIAPGASQVWVDVQMAS